MFGFDNLEGKFAEPDTKRSLKAHWKPTELSVRKLSGESVGHHQSSFKDKLYNIYHYHSVNWNRTKDQKNKIYLYSTSIMHIELYKFNIILQQPNWNFDYGDTIETDQNNCWKLRRNLRTPERPPKKSSKPTWNTSDGHINPKEWDISEYPRDIPSKNPKMISFRLSIF